MVSLFARIRRHFAKGRPFGILVAYALNNRAFRWALRTRAYNQLTLRRIKAITSTFDLPITLQIEPTNICNAKCVMCPNPTHKRPRGYMSMQLFKKIIGEVRTIPTVRELILSGFGEPFLDKRMIEKIEYAKQNTDKSTIVYSNFGIATEAIMRRIISSKLDVLNISFNGSSAESYNKTMKIDFETSKANITRFLELRKELRSKTPLVIISCVLTEYNEADAERLRSMWSAADGVYIGPPDNWIGSVNINLKKNAFMTQTKPFTYPCKLFGPGINWNGDMIFCCRDYAGAMIFGNIAKDSLITIWNSPRYREFRYRHYQGALEGICAQCDVPHKQNGLRWWQGV